VRSSSVPGLRRPRIWRSRRSGGGAKPVPLSYKRKRFAFSLDPEIIQRELEALARELMDDGHDVAARGLEIAETAGLTLESRVTPRQGSESQTILSEADTAEADLIICGSRGRGAVARSLLGSTSTSVLHHATRPVLVVPADPGAIDGPALIAYDGSAGARAAIAVAGRLLRGRRAMIVNVWNSPMRHTLSGRALAGAPLGELREFSADYEQFFADAAASVVEERVTLAREAGLDAAGEAIESGSGAWRALAEGCKRPPCDGDRRRFARTRWPGLHDPRLGLVGPRPQRRDAGAGRPTGELRSQDGAGASRRGRPTSSMTCPPCGRSSPSGSASSRYNGLTLGAVRRGATVRPLRRTSRR
jgi:nucleotide-binding universal stress UspA family protein